MEQFSLGLKPVFQVAPELAPAAFKKLIGTASDGLKRVFQLIKGGKRFGRLGRFFSAF